MRFTQEIACGQLGLVLLEAVRKMWCMKAGTAPMPTFRVLPKTAALAARAAVQLKSSSQQF